MTISDIIFIFFIVLFIVTFIIFTFYSVYRFHFNISVVKRICSYLYVKLPYISINYYYYLRKQTFSKIIAQTIQLKPSINPLKPSVAY